MLVHVTPVPVVARIFFGINEEKKVWHAREEKKRVVNR